MEVGIVSGDLGPLTLHVGALAQQMAGSSKDHARSAGSRPALEKGRAAHERPSLHSAAEAATGQPHAPSEPAKACQQQQQPQQRASAVHGGAAEQSKSGQRQKGPAGSRCFTPGQQAVAAALMVVIKCAMKGGAEAPGAAKRRQWPAPQQPAIGAECL
ncbi:g5530 [Coccomyxa viridis]|uniref:G5530 protein n=1 Tax=Coccomyxa viridis TaxID=1274662 RepID=A0ABP1FY64_9CHLO